MKKLFLFIAACMMASAMQATVALTCGFEASEGWDGGFANGWSTEVVSWGDEVWNLYTTNGHQGTQCLRITAGDWSTEDAYLNFPTIDFGADEVECTITFWAKMAGGASVYFDADEVEITSTGWAQYSYTMTVSGEQNLQLDGYVEDGQVLYIDDIEVSYPGEAPANNDIITVYAYYPDLVALFKWDVRVNINDGEEFLAAYVLDSIDILDPNTTIDGISGGFINEITVNAPDGVTYDGATAGAASESGMGYWMYNLNDQMAQLGISSQPVVAGDVIFWEFKTDWSSWDITQLADVPSNVYRVDFGVINGTPTYADTTAFNCDSFTWHGQTYTRSGDYTYTEGLLITTLHLTIGESVTTDLYETACNSYSWHDATYTHSGTYRFNGQTVLGCDSTVVLHLTINKSVSEELTESACDSYTWNGEQLTQSGDYTFNGHTAAGCDSTVVLHLTINKSTYDEQTITATGSYVWNGQTYTESGDYTFNGQTAEGCDAVEVLHLTIEAESALGNVEAESARKFIRDGQLFIRKGDSVFDILGNQVK